jgi:maltose alpha-D-glucosyltransferase/alpha-amylase
MNGLLFSLPGTPVIYYGDEIGMGDNIYLGDRNGVRTPMQWSPDRNAGFSRANRQRLYLPPIMDPEYHYEAVNVEAQRANPYSLLNWTRRLISLRKQVRAFGRGTFELVRCENRKLLAFTRKLGAEQILVVANLSRFAQAAGLDLSAFAGQVPVELWGRTEFPAVGEAPYFLTLGPHAFYWFALQPKPAIQVVEEPRVRPEASLPVVGVAESWEELVSARLGARQEAILPAYIRDRRWFGGKARRLKSARVGEVIPVPLTEGTALTCLVEVAYVEGEEETYALPLCYSTDPEGALEQQIPQALVARIEGPNGLGLVYDALYSEQFSQALLQVIARRRKVHGRHGDMLGVQTRGFRELRGSAAPELEASLSRAEQSNSSVVFGERLILKTFRRIEPGPNPEVELGRFLTERTTFRQIAPVAGSLEYRPRKGEPWSLAVLTAYVPNQGDAWQWTQEELNEYFGRAAGDLRPELVGDYLEAARCIGRRTAELHRALASDGEDPNFAPEPTSTLDRRSFYQSARRLAGEAMGQLRSYLDRMPAATGDLARTVLGRETQINTVLRQVLDRSITAQRIRTHGDYHLGQLLRTGDDFVVIDFEGEPSRSLSERRLKRWPLRDVAGMLRSFDYAVFAQFRRQERAATLVPWAELWARSVSQAFLDSYQQSASGAAFLPRTGEESAWLLRVLLLEKALYELSYELNNRPDWVEIPLRGLLQLDLDGSLRMTGDQFGSQPAQR